VHGSSQEMSHRFVVFKEKIKEASSITRHVNVIMELSSRDLLFSDLFQRPPSLRAHLQRAKNFA
jgi:hypothetical protein